MRIFHITQKESARELSQEGLPGASSFPAKWQAVNIGTRQAEEKWGILKIHRAGGTMEDERVFPRPVSGN
jgi:hypothetical protein